MRNLSMIAEEMLALQSEQARFYAMFLSATGTPLDVLLEKVGRTEKGGIRKKIPREAWDRFVQSVWNTSKPKFIASAKKQQEILMRLAALWEHLDTESEQAWEECTNSIVRTTLEPLKMQWPERADSLGDVPSLQYLRSLFALSSLLPLGELFAGRKSAITGPIAL